MWVAPTIRRLSKCDYFRHAGGPDPIILMALGAELRSPEEEDISPALAALTPVSEFLVLGHTL